MIKVVSIAKISSEIYKRYSSYPQKHIPAKYLKNLSMKIIFLGKNFIRSLIFFPKGFLESIGVSEEINLR